MKCDAIALQNLVQRLTVARNSSSQLEFAMLFNMALTDLFRVFLLGIALILTIPELALLAVFTRHTISQGSTYTFEIVGLVTSSLTLLLLSVLVFGPRIWPSFPTSLPIFEIPMLGVLSSLWLALVILQLNQRNKWYPIPKAYRDQGVSGCQLAPNGQEAHWCNQLSSTSSLAVVILVFILLQMVFLLIIALLFQLDGTPVWTRNLGDALYQNVPTRQPQRSQVPTPHSRPPVYKLQPFGGPWKKGKKAGILSETASVQDGSDYISVPVTDSQPPTLPLNLNFGSLL